MNLEWSGQKAFVAEPLRPWYASSEAAAAGTVAGEYRSAGNLTFAIVNDAGHFVSSCILGHYQDLANNPFSLDRYHMIDL